MEFRKIGKQAAEYYERTTKNGEGCADWANAAAGVLGTLYEGGLGVPQNFAQAAKWYRIAAERGDASAQSNLGQMLSAGRGMKRDVIQAHKWLNLACANGDNEACGLRDRVATRMTADQIETAQRMAGEWKPKPDWTAK